MTLIRPIRELRRSRDFSLKTPAKRCVCNVPTCIKVPNESHNRSALRSCREAERYTFLQMLYQLPKLLCMQKLRMSVLRRFLVPWGIVTFHSNHPSYTFHMHFVPSSHHHSHASNFFTKSTTSSSACSSSSKCAASQLPAFPSLAAKSLIEVRTASTPPF